MMEKIPAFAGMMSFFGIEIRFPSRTPRRKVPPNKVGWGVSYLYRHTNKKLPESLYGITFWHAGIFFKNSRSELDIPLNPSRLVRTGSLGRGTLKIIIYL